MRRRERRRLAVAVISTAIAIPLLVVEVAPGADASPDSSPAAFIAEELPAIAERALGTVSEPTDAAPQARSLGSLSGDDLAAPRPLAALSTGVALRAAAAAEAAEAEAARQAEEERLRRLEEEQAALEAQREAEAARQAEADARRAAADEIPAAAPAPGMPTPQQWGALRQCESSGNYQAASPNGLYYGAYQFYQGTWDNTARIAGRHDLVGVRPDHAAPADQDAMAQALFARRGAQPWPHCGVHLR